MSAPLVFAHGAGRAGAAAWPRQTELANTAFVTFPGYGDDPPRPTDIGSWVQTLHRAVIGPVHLIAHSYGAIAAVLAAGQSPGWCRSLLLFEPALYSLARGGASVERHITRMVPVVAEAPNLDTASFWSRWMTVMTGVVPDPPVTAQALTTAERFRLLTPPWAIEIPSSTMADVDTLVVTGAWNEEYEEIAAALVRAGARHRRLPGRGHRVVDHPGANQLIIDWVAAHEP